MHLKGQIEYFQNVIKTKKKRIRKYSQYGNAESHDLSLIGSSIPV